MQDRALRGNPREVYVWFHEHLDLCEFRLVKQARIEIALGLSDASVSDAVKRIVSRGYLDLGPREGRVQSFRLLYSRRCLENEAIPAQTGEVTVQLMKR